MGVFIRAAYRSIKIFMVSALVASITFAASNKSSKHRNKKKHFEKNAGGYCEICRSQPLGQQQQQQFDTLKLIKNKLNDISGPNWASFPEVLKYSENKKVLASISYGMSHKFASTRSRCYEYIKKAMLYGGHLIDEIPNIAKAIESVPDLENRGFINMLEDARYKNLITKPSDAPQGAYLVYKSKKNGVYNKKQRRWESPAGHIEQKTGWGEKSGYVSDFYHEFHDGMTQYELVAVMFNPDL